MHHLLGEIVEMLLVAAGKTIAKMLGVDSLVELMTAVAGLSFIAIGFTAWWMGH